MFEGNIFSADQLVSLKLIHTDMECRFDQFELVELDGMGNRTDYRIDNELFVVQINQVSNASFMNPCDFPEHVQHLLQRMKEDDENQKIAEEKEKNTCSVQLYCHHPKRGRIDMPLKVTTAARKEYQKRKKAI